MRATPRLAPVVALLAAISILAGCTETGAPEGATPSYAAAIRHVIEADERLGAARNHASENAPIAQAVRAYVAGLDALDLAPCPPDFAAAMRRHRDAWHDSIEFFEQYADLRGELHEVFEAIRARDEASRVGLERAEAAIWGTWAEVEQAMDMHPE